MTRYIKYYKHKVISSGGFWKKWVVVIERNDKGKSKVPKHALKSRWAKATTIMMKE